MSTVIIHVEFEKETINSVRYKATPEEGTLLFVGSLDV
jgi:hypothetical protein